VTTYLRMPRSGDRLDTIYEVLGSGVKSGTSVEPQAPIIWTRTVSGFGHVQNGRIRNWTRRELEGTDIVAISAEEAV
jgi:hypothetical protein